MVVILKSSKVWQNSEYKTSLAAKQLRAVNPTQLQMYTVQVRPD